jgi:hypothetical protein
MSNIFIQIASYRDPDLKNTINDLINNSSNKYELSFGVCDQNDTDRFLDYSKFSCGSIKVLQLDYKKSHGACWARSLTQSLYDNEDFTLQIDSHTRSESDWDIKLLNLYKNLNNPKAIISTYPSIFIPSQSYEQYNKNIYKCHVYKMENGLIKTRPVKLNNESQPVPASAVAAGFIFGPSSIITDVKYDPEFYFSGEEAALAIRYFTNGYDLYHPQINLFYHYYTRKEQHKHWTDHKNWSNYSKRASDRLNCLLGRNQLFDLKEYGLGSARSFEEWRIYSGIDYKNNKLHQYLIDDKPAPYPDTPDLWVNENNL